MSTYNVEMSYFNGSGYDQLYPRSKMSNISDWNSYVYSKSQVDSNISSINGRIDTINNTISDMQNDITTISSNYVVQEIGEYNLTSATASLFNIDNYLPEYDFIIMQVTECSSFEPGKDGWCIQINYNQIPIIFNGTFEKYKIVLVNTGYFSGGSFEDIPYKAFTMWKLYDTNGNRIVFSGQLQISTYYVNSYKLHCVAVKLADL